jgi:hypothetical protein
MNITKEFIRKATHPHPCPLPSRERGLKDRPSLEGRVFKCVFTYERISKFLLSVMPEVLNRASSQDYKTSGFPLKTLRE